MKDLDGPQVLMGAMVHYVKRGCPGSVLPQLACQLVGGLCLQRKDKLCPGNIVGAGTIGTCVRSLGLYTMMGALSRLYHYRVCLS